MNPGDEIRLHMFDTRSGFRVTVDDLTTGRSGSMTASAANGFEEILFDPHGTTCQGIRTNYHPMYDTANPAGRNFNAAHTGNIGFSDEVGHFEYCAKVRNDALGTCDQPLGDDTNDPDNAGLDPAGDDVLCLPGSLSTKVKIGGCTNTDGDFDSVSYKFSWPGSISNPTADRLLNAQPVRFTSPLTHGHNFGRMAFESNISRSESDDTEFNHAVGPYIPGTVNKFGGSAQKEYGPLRQISYPTAPFGQVTIRLNDFRSARMNNPCPASP